ncbi:MAG: hypothetical protein ACYC8T_02940 [Myxococcaceae bacterium]
MLALPICALLLAAPGFQSRVEPGRVQLGEPFVYELVLTHDKGQRAELRTPGDLGAFEVLDQKRSRHDGKEAATTTFKLQLSLFELGKKKLPDLTFDLVDAEGRASQFVAPGIDVETLSALPKDADEKGEGLYDIRANEDVPVRTWRLLYGLAALAAAVALGYALYRYLKRPRLAPVVPPEPSKPLHVRTLAALDELRALNLPGQGLVRDFHFRLSEILRGYLGERYGFEALESTSYELLDALRRLHTPGLPAEELSRFTVESDLVKFAKAVTGPDECKASLEFGYRLVHLTTAAPQPLPGNARPQLP